ncbi:auxin response factor 13-like [Malus domestica]|uniref:auxin response factor 13-like n=1 Tax=Malus domestica TaxID=3750 RepID=UPI0039768B96
MEASTNQLADQQMPVYNLASKILCRVINVSLKAEPDTNEVFSQVTLLPKSNFSEWLCHTLLFFLSKWGRFATCHSTNRKKVLNRTIGRQKGYNCYDWIEHGMFNYADDHLFYFD